MSLTTTTARRRLTRGSIATAAALLAVTPAAFAATPRAAGSADGGASVRSAAVAPRRTSSPFTVGLSSARVTPGSKVTIAGLAYARAGKPITISSDAIGSTRTVNGLPSVQTPAFVEGTYRTTVLVPPATRPGTYPVVVRFGGRQVASTSLRVVARGTQPASRTTGQSSCAGIGFSVLHNDRTGGVALPAGSYRVTSRNLDCGTASADFTQFLDRYQNAIPGWVGTQQAPGQGTFTQRGTGLSFSVARAR
jgi:hypothetical protein